MAYSRNTGICALADMCTTAICVRSEGLKFWWEIQNFDRVPSHHTYNRSLRLTTFAFTTNNVRLKQSNNSIARPRWSLPVLLDTYVPCQMFQSSSNSLATSLTPHLVLQMNRNTSASTVASPCMLFVGITLRTSSTKQSSTTMQTKPTISQPSASHVTLPLVCISKKQKQRNIKETEGRQSSINQSIL